MSHVQLRLGDSCVKLCVHRKPHCSYVGRFMYKHHHIVKVDGMTRLVS